MTVSTAPPSLAPQLTPTVMQTAAALNGRLHAGRSAAHRGRPGLQCLDGSRGPAEAMVRYLADVPAAVIAAIGRAARRGGARLGAAGLGRAK